MSDGLMDLCNILARPSAYVDPSMLRSYLVKDGIELTDEDPDLPEEWIDEVFFDQLINRVGLLAEEDWTNALSISQETSLIPLIAIAPLNSLMSFSTSAAAACLHVPIGLNVLKHTIQRIRDALGPEASTIAFGEAQFLYTALGEFEDSQKIYDYIFSSNISDTDTQRRLINFGHSLIYSTLNAESKIWAEIFSFRVEPAGFDPLFTSKNLTPQQQNLMLRLWERKWKKWQNS